MSMTKYAPKPLVLCQLVAICLFLPSCVIGASDDDGDEPTSTQGMADSVGSTSSSSASESGSSAATGSETAAASTGSSDSSGSTDTGSTGESGSSESQGTTDEGSSETDGGDCGHVDMPVPGATGCEVYDECIAANCAETATYCMGSDFLTLGTYDPERPCGVYVPCALACDCAIDAVACVAECGPAAELNCLSCFGSLNDCALEQCGELAVACPE